MPRWILWKNCTRGTPGSRTAAAAYLHREAHNQLRGEPPVSLGSDGTLETWTWSVEEHNVVAHALVPAEAAAVAAARLAKDAYELEPSDENTLLLLVSLLQVDQSLGGLDAPLRQGAGTAHAFGLQAGPAVVSGGAACCLERQLDAAAIGATELLAAIGDTSTVTSGRPWSPLVRALQSPNRRVRYNAAKAIMTIDPRERYAGASFLVEAIAELAGALGHPRALIGTPRQDVADQLSGQLGGMGFQTTPIAVTRELLHEAMETSDYDVLFVSDSISRPSAYEFIQQLRKDPQSRYLPVVLLVREGRLDQGQQIAARDERTLIMPEFADDTVISKTLEEAERSVLGVAVPPLRRVDQAQDALRWMGHLAEYSRTYQGYDVMRGRAAAEAAVAVPSLSDAAIDVLGYLGDQASQELLVETASQPGVAVGSRQRAANAFTEAVLRRGLMLPAADVKHQYARYHDSEAAGATTQEILRQILDVIETQTKSSATTSQ